MAAIIERIQQALDGHSKALTELARAEEALAEARLGVVTADEEKSRAITAERDAKAKVDHLIQRYTRGDR